MPWSRNFPGQFDVRSALERLLTDPRYDEYYVAMAYIDGAGARMLDTALDRGADLTLVMPRTPNVYHDANRKVGMRNRGL